MLCGNAGAGGILLYMAELELEMRRIVGVLDLWFSEIIF